MLKTLDYDKNINYAFTITTPFPGTQLYDIALMKGIIKNHLDFYNKFDKDKDMNGLSANLSAMSDEEIIELHKKIKSIYLNRKRELVGKKVRMVEIIRYFIYRVYNKIAKKLVDRLPESQPFIFIKKIYHESHNMVQLLLDKLRLYLLNIK